jgi:hypothetical protein
MTGATLWQQVGDFVSHGCEGKSLVGRCPPETVQNACCVSFRVLSVTPRLIAEIDVQPFDGQHGTSCGFLGKIEQEVQIVVFR